MKDKFIENGIEYVRQGDYYIPNLTVPDEKEYNIGKYGRLRRTFLKEHHNWLYSTMLMQGTLLKHLAEIDEICNRDEVYNLAEKCANTGFGILKDWTEHLDEETLFYKLIGYMDKTYEEIKDEIDNLIK